MRWTPACTVLGVVLSQDPRSTHGPSGLAAETMRPLTGSDATLRLWCLNVKSVPSTGFVACTYHNGVASLAQWVCHPTSASWGLKLKYVVYWICCQGVLLKVNAPNLMRWVQLLPLAIRPQSTMFTPDCITSTPVVDVQLLPPDCPVGAHPKYVWS